MRSQRMRRFALIAVLVLAACSPDPVGVKSGDAEPVAVIDSAPKMPTATAVDATPASTATEEPTLVVESEGLRWLLPPDGSAKTLAFGAPKSDVLASLERVRGRAGKGVNQDCGAGPVEYANWPDGLSLIFQNGTFAGWGLDLRASGALATADGVGPGTTRSVLTNSIGSVTFQNTSLGTEFSAGDIFGLLDGTGPEAKVTHIWAGVSCVAR